MLLVRALHWLWASYFQSRQLFFAATSAQLVPLQLVPPIARAAKSLLRQQLQLQNLLLQNLLLRKLQL